MAAAVVDLYEVLGVARSATAAEMRHAYRRLALAHHPDRAGPASAPRFAAIADAYRVLSDPLARATYDATLADQAAWRRRDAGPVHSGGVAWNVSTNNWQASRPVHYPNLLERLSGRLTDLLATGAVRQLADGVLELDLTPAEAHGGGTAAIVMTVQVACATCGGIARPRGVWCRTCEHAGTVAEDVTVPISVPRNAPQGGRIDLKIPRAREPQLRVHLRVG